MKILMSLFGVVHSMIALLFALGALALIAIATRMGILALTEGWTLVQAQALIEAIGILAAAVVAFQIAETITEEEVVRDTNISAPTRVRRFLSRFFVVLIVALAIEGLVATFRAVHEEPEGLLYAAALLAGTALLLAAWGLFIYLNRAAEDLEPDAMVAAKREDRKLDR